LRNKKSYNDVDTLVFCAGEDDDVDIWDPFLEDRFGNGDEMTDGLVMLKISEGVNRLSRLLKNLDRVEVRTRY
jgi:hypothetical protein